MRFVQRKILFKLYPSSLQSERMEEALGLHCRAYNALLEEHRRRFEAGEDRFTFHRMCQAITQWRAISPGLSALNAQALQVTAKRAALAFEAFFRRVKDGGVPGYPRFKPFGRYPGWGYKTYGDGWKLHAKVSSAGIQYTQVTLGDVGRMTLRGKGRFRGTPKTAEVLRKGSTWYLSVTFNVPEHEVARPTTNAAAAFDWGVKTLLTIARHNGGVEAIENPRWLKFRLAALADLQRTVSDEEAICKSRQGLDPAQPMPKGVRLQVSGKLKRLYAQVRALHGKIARQRKDFHHKISTALVERFGFLATETLNVSGMTRSPSPKQDDTTGVHLPNGAAAKAGLNRGILDAAPSALLGLIRTKAEEAACRFAEANTRVLKPTQRCHRCGAVVPKRLDERTHRCACGCVCDRDENAARTLLRWLLEGEAWLPTKAATNQHGAGTVPGAATRSETPPIAAPAV